VLNAGLDEFIADIGSELGDARRISRATEYVDALLIDSPEEKSFAQLARLASGGLAPAGSTYKLEQSFQHLVNGSSWEPDALLRPAAERIAREIDVHALMLLAVVFPRLGEHAPQYPDNRKGGQQIASVLQMVGLDARGEPVILPIRWKLSLEEERWRDPRMRERADVDYAVGGHISVHGSRHAATVLEWDLPDVPLVAGPSYDWLRAQWLWAQKWNYIVELPTKAVWDSTEQLETLLATRPDEPRLTGPAMRMGTTAEKARCWAYSLNGQMGRELVVVAGDEFAGTEKRAKVQAWCTNLKADSPNDRERILALAGLRANAEAFWDELRYGLLGAAGYRGLSVKGWERHCALVTAAQAYRIKAGISDQGAPPRLPSGRDPELDRRDWRSKLRRSWLASQ
jgi:hypothetical protein